jgi:hypothetical protein
MCTDARGRKSTQCFKYKASLHFSLLSALSYFSITCKAKPYESNYNKKTLIKFVNLTLRELRMSESIVLRRIFGARIRKLRRTT